MAEVATHEELADAGGLYAALWRVQTGGAAYRGLGGASDAGDNLSLTPRVRPVETPGRSGHT